MTPSPSSPSPTGPADLSSHLIQIASAIGMVQGQLTAMTSMLTAEQKAREAMENRFREEIKALRDEAAVRQQSLTAPMDAMRQEVHQIRNRIWYASGVAAAVLWAISTFGPMAASALFARPAAPAAAASAPPAR